MRKTIVVTIAVIIFLILVFKVDSQGPDLKHQVFIPLSLTADPVDQFCIQPINNSQGPWPYCPKVRFSSGSGSHYDGEFNPYTLLNIQGSDIEWTVYKVYRMPSSLGSPWDTNFDTNPVYNLSNWELVAELEPVSQNHYIFCAPGSWLYTVQGDKFIPDPRNVQIIMSHSVNVNVPACE